MKRLLLIILFINITSACLAQDNKVRAYNNYKYVVIPNQFPIQDAPNEYRINSLLRYLFKQNGFTVYMESELSVISNQCEGLKVDLQMSGALLTNTYISLIDCNGNIVFKSSRGRSKEKEYEKAYHESIRMAFESYGQYKYQEREEVAEEKQEINKVEASNEDNFYVYKDEVYAIIPSEDSSFDIVKKDFYAKATNENKVVGNLVETSRKGNYVLKMGDVQASAYFDEAGHLVFELLNDKGELSVEKFIKR